MAQYVEKKKKDSIILLTDFKCSFEYNYFKGLIKSIFKLAMN